MRELYFFKLAATGNVGSASSCSANYLIPQQSGSADHNLLKRHTANYQFSAKYEYFVKNSHL
jgi:hypothetical protein